MSALHYRGPGGHPRVLMANATISRSIVVIKPLTSKTHASSTGLSLLVNTEVKPTTSSLPCQLSREFRKGKSHPDTNISLEFANHVRARSCITITPSRSPSSTGGKKGIPRTIPRPHRPAVTVRAVVNNNTAVPNDRNGAITCSHQEPVMIQFGGILSHSPDASLCHGGQGTDSGTMTSNVH